MNGRGSCLVALAFVAMSGLCSCGGEGPVDVAGPHPPPPVPETPHRVAVLVRGGDPELADVPVEGFKEGMGLFQFTEGSYYTADVVDLGGDPDAAPARIDRAAREGAAVIVITHPDVLRAALGRPAGGPPIAFGLLGDPLALGAGEADDRHRSDATGAYNPLPAFALLGRLKTYLPQATRVGVVFDGRDPLSMAHKDAMIRDAPRLELVIEPADVGGEAGVPAATEALLGAEVDAICLAAGLGPAAAEVIASARRAGVPTFGFLAEHVRDGALAAEIPDLELIGLEAGRMVYHLLSGREPGKLPLILVRNTSTLVNLDVLDELAITLPPGALRDARTVGGAPDAAE